MDEARLGGPLWSPVGRWDCVDRGEGLGNYTQLPYFEPPSFVILSASEESPGCIRGQYQPPAFANAHSVLWNKQRWQESLLSGPTGYASQ